MRNSQIRAAAAIDIGTTNVQASLIDLDTGGVLETTSELNAQRSFGADVMSRISAAQNGRLNELFFAINNQVETMLRNFISRRNLSAITQCAVSGNTVMLHLFCRADPSPMGYAPYTPNFLNEQILSGAELSLSAAQVTMLPGVSAFVGADITAGLAFIDIMSKGENALFIDVGTNGEIALFIENEKKLLCCSTAAGSCFEETEINCGLNASDFINTVAQMKRENIIDETGALADKFKDSGFPVKDGKIITQKNVREFQLAKSAIYSGIKTICKTAHLDLKNICAVYIAGGFGEHLNLESAAEIGFLPQEFIGREEVKTQVCGNTSLKGAEQSLIDPAFLPRCREIITHAAPIDLANDKYFAAAFEHNMWF